ncbi:EAL domain-containing protein [Dactylosporangium aurantiacum]|uniref:EAL domain-containing protein n=1 Tax=Dactylosporangium aurantiacum TaxID=35754 RepID=A0A9Q9MDU1_9ACTN|nr:EAL domain-containing protein [Dactylosporangium aurantiacum]MDG6106975.1 EAL domain-containing protein [Dactylosporangium aurantiacum]UWZ50665.1 EAL domain-containing protein [Dactylosporangium aurantiacum]
MSLRRKLVGGYVLVAVLVALVGAVAWRVDVRSAQRAAITEAEHVAYGVAKDVAFGLAADTSGENPGPLYDNPEGLAAYLDRLGELQGRDIVVVDARQRVLGDAVPENIGTVFDHDTADEVGATVRDRVPRTFVEVSVDYPDGIKQLVVPLVGRDGTTLGAVILEYTPLYDEMVASTRRAQLTIAAVCTAGVLLVLLVGGLLAASLTRRVATLTTAVLDVRDGGYERRVPAGGRDELHRLGRAFNDMAAELERSAREILAKEYTDAILASAAEGICGVDQHDRITFANAAAGRLTGLGVDGLLGEPAATVLPHIEPALGDGRGDTVREHDMPAPDGSSARVSCTISPIMKDGRRAGAVVLLRDVTRQRALEHELRHQALHDGLTGLPNRALFNDRLEQAMARGAAGHGRVGVLFVDLDGFKRVNDSLGHSAGDQLLQTASDRLRAAVRPGDTVARFGGDEFGILVEPADDAAVALMPERLLRAMGEPFLLAGREVTVTASIGAVWDAGRHADAGEVVRNADVAMYAAKEQGKARCVAFQADMHTRLVDQLDQERRLRVAIDRGELRLYLQPIVDTVAGRTEGVEALVRWQDPQAGLRAPGTFLPLAESTGLITDIDRWVLRESCLTLRAWQDEDPAGAPDWITVNISAALLDSPDLPDLVTRTLRDTGLRPEALLLEVTETTLMRDVAGTAPRLERLRSCGVRIAIDDFGTGYSSLGYLRDIPADVLKIDRSFLDGLVGSARHRDLLAAVVQLGHTLGLRVVAEGVEDAAQLAELVGLGCRYAQGYHLARPAPVAALRAAAQPVGG